jgi:hypothetical protein
MAPIDPTQTPTSGRKAKTVTIEEEDSWEELATEPELPTTSKALPRPAGIPPAVAATARRHAEIQRAQGLPGPTVTLPGGGVWQPPFSGPFPPSAPSPFASNLSPPYPPVPPQVPHNSFGPNYTSVRIQQLQIELTDIATCELGLLNSVRVLEQHLIKSPQPVKPRKYAPMATEWTGVSLDAFSGPLSSNLSMDRSGALTTIHNMAHLLGLSRAVRLLREALEDKDRVDETYELRLLQFPLATTGPMAPVPPMPQSCMPQSCIMPPPPLSCLKENDVKKIVKEVLKESTSSEESQKEMIKLVRDVCMSSLQRN